MKEVFCGKAPEWLINVFFNYGVKLTEIGACGALDAPVAHHIDMMAFKVPGQGEKSLIVTPESADSVLNQRRVQPEQIIITEKHLGSKYPDDVLLNAAVVGRFLICNERYVAEEVKQAARDSGLEIVGVKQGYAKCSICIVSDEAIITEDISIYEACKDKLSVLLIEKGYVRLPGYDCGFIGGASALIDDNVYFFGSIEKHPESEKIKEFIEYHGKNCISLLPCEPLIDIGGIIEL